MATVFFGQVEIKTDEKSFGRIGNIIGTFIKDVEGRRNKIRMTKGRNKEEAKQTKRQILRMF